MEDAPIESLITKNQSGTLINIVLSSKQKITGEILIDILEQLIDDYREQPEALMDGADQININ